MVFWKTYPIRKYFDSIWSNSPFTSLIFKRDETIIPENMRLEILTNPASCPRSLGEVREFIKSYFGNPPKTPVLDIPIKKLLGNKDHILIVRHINNNQIIGCIRYKYIGKLLIGKLLNSNPEIYYEDCFCIHPDWRKKGIGDYLLTTLHNYVNKNNIPYSLFLKEGRSLGVIHKPLFSGDYVFRKTSENNMLTNENNLQVKQPMVNNENIKVYKLTANEAIQLISLFEETNPKKSLVIINPESNDKKWLLFSSGFHKILICYQDTFQWTFNRLDLNENNMLTKQPLVNNMSTSENSVSTSENNKNKFTIGWITGWFETKDISLEIKTHAISLFLREISKQFDYVWANSQWIPSPCNWKKDGQFHWYAYQWTTNLNIKNNYCITI